MKKGELLLEIEKTRSEMQQLARKHSLFSGIVLSKSRQLDQLLNQYTPFHNRRHASH